MDSIGNARSLLRTICLITALLVPAGTAQAQYESLNPRSWFPLEEGNAWSYNFEFEWWTLVSTIDTVMMDLSWRRLDVVKCIGPNCPLVDLWYAFDVDDYLLRTRNFSDIDTVISTQPTSFFRTTVAFDTTLGLRCGGPDLERVEVTIQESSSGSPADSTNLVMSVRPRGGIIFCEQDDFVYKIGRRGHGDFRLTGAIVNGLEWGNAEPLRVVLSSETEVYRLGGIHIQSYPNPARELLTVEVRVVETGLYDFSITTLLGQTISEGRHFILADVPTTVNVRLRDVAPGLYFLRFTNDVEAHFKPIVVTR